jgi:hypothetical protein
LNDIAILQSCIDSLVKEFQLNPFNFLYEIDLQAFLFSIAFDKFESIRIRGGYWSDKYEDYNDRDYNYDKTIETKPVKCEYPTTKRFDIALIDSKKKSDYDKNETLKKHWKNEPFWNQPLKAAIELKYIQLGDNSKINAIKKDINKLKKYRNERDSFTGIVLIFFQSKYDPKRFIKEYKTIFTANKEQVIIPTDGLFCYIVTPKIYEKYRLI